MSNSDEKLSFISAIGRGIIAFLEVLGCYVVFAYRALSGLWRHTWSLRDLVEQLEKVGVGSVIMVSITSAFTGMVMAVQTLDQFLRFGAGEYIGGVIALSLIREMSPVLTGLVVAGRVGASMAAEIGTMRVTEQLDALKAFGLNDEVFVGAPRIVSSMIMLPVLTIYSFVVGIGGGYLYVVAHGVHRSTFRRSIEVLVDPYDVYGGLLKALVFGLIIATVACSEGFRAGNGAKGVGEATTRAVVWGDMLILTFNYFLSTLLFGGGG